MKHYDSSLRYITTCETPAEHLREVKRNIEVLYDHPATTPGPIALNFVDWTLRCEDVTVPGILTRLEFASTQIDDTSLRAMLGELVTLFEPFETPDKGCTYRKLKPIIKVAIPKIDSIINALEPNTAKLAPPPYPILNYLMRS